MAPLNGRAVARRLRLSGSAFVQVFAQVVFSRSRIAGLFLVIAAATEPRSLGLGLSALLAALGTARALGISAPPAETPYGYNALLVGLGVGHAFAFDAASVVFAAALGGLSVFVTGGLSTFVGRIVGLPVLSLPFVVTSCLALGVVAHVPLVAAYSLRDPLSDFVPPQIALLLQCFGAILFIPRIASGVLVLMALLVHSRIATMLAVAAVAMTLGLSAVFRMPLADTTFQGVAFNAALVAIAVGGVWFVPSTSSFVLGLASALLSVLFSLGFSGPLSRLGLPLSIFPFNLTVLLVFFTLRNRSQDKRPKAVEAVAVSPEEALLAFRAHRPSYAGPYPIRFHLPFRGTWSCTQGVDGAFTHKGIWRNAYDFEVHGDAEGALCVGEGARLEDYHCFRLPVLAAADGTVVSVENDVPDNAVGGVDVERNWGNWVVIQHGIGLYSVVAHLARGSARVYIGQFVRRGEIVGHCGNSGRSPRPHLHFQLQSSAILGSPTLPCRFANVVVRSPAGDRLEMDRSPSEGEALRNLEPDNHVGAYFDFPLGHTLSFLCDEVAEHVACELDLWGRFVFRSRERAASLAYGIGEDCFTTYDVSGSRSSVLYLLRVALSRVPFEDAALLKWTDRLPEKWVGGWLRRLVWDFAAPFSGKDGIEIEYRMRAERGRLVVCGESTARDRNGVPLVQTRAELMKGMGPVLVEVMARGRTHRAEVLASHGGSFVRASLPREADSIPGGLAS